MKKQFLNLGKALNIAEQKQINGGMFGNPCSPELWTCITNFDCCGYSEDEVYGYPTGTDVRCIDNHCKTRAQMPM